MTRDAAFPMSLMVGIKSARKEVDPQDAINRAYSEQGVCARLCQRRDKVKRLPS